MYLRPDNVEVSMLNCDRSVPYLPKAYTIEYSNCCHTSTPCLSKNTPCLCSNQAGSQPLTAYISPADRCHQHLCDMPSMPAVLSVTNAGVLCTHTASPAAPRQQQRQGTLLRHNHNFGSETAITPHVLRGTFEDGRQTEAPWVKVFRTGLATPHPP